MHLDTRTFLRVFCILAVLDTVAFAVVFVPRPALTEEQWRTLEDQRPTPFVPGQPDEFSACADCLNFAVFRRAIGGQESIRAKYLQLANLPGFLVAFEFFGDRQLGTSGISKLNSDLATLVLVMVTLLQCALLSVPFAVRRRVTAVRATSLTGEEIS